MDIKDLLPLLEKAGKELLASGNLDKFSALLKTFEGEDFTAKADEAEAHVRALAVNFGAMDDAQQAQVMNLSNMAMRFRGMATAKAMNKEAVTIIREYVVPAVEFIIPLAAKALDIAL